MISAAIRGRTDVSALLTVGTALGHEHLGVRRVREVRWVEVRILAGSLILGRSVDVPDALIADAEAGEAAAGVITRTGS